MALTYSEPVKLGMPAPDFSLPGVDGKTWGLKDFSQSKALVVMFICNHCPYVKAVQGRISVLAKTYSGKGVSFVGISSNDATRYPEDSFETMKKVAKEQGYVFPYLYDETQKVAREYGAVCTPEFYAFERGKKVGEWLLSYRGRLDDNWKEESQVRTHDLADALDAILAGGKPKSDQQPSMGCSIKWK